MSHGTSFHTNPSLRGSNKGSVGPNTKAKQVGLNSKKDVDIIDVDVVIDSNPSPSKIINKLNRGNAHQNNAVDNSDNARQPWNNAPQ